MMDKVYDFFKSILWYIVDFIYGLVDSIIEIIRQLNAFDIIDSLSNNSFFQKLYSGIFSIALTLLALFIIWRIINKIIDPEDSGGTIQSIIIDSIKCVALILMSTFLFVQASNFSINLSSYVGNSFETKNSSMSSSILELFVAYDSDYKKSDQFSEKKDIKTLLKTGDFGKDEVYLEKYKKAGKHLFADSDYKYDINWIMALLVGGFFLYSLAFAGIMLGRRQIEFLFLFAIAPIVFSTSINNKQRRGAVFEELISLALQSAVIILVVSLSIMVMQEVNSTTFFDTGGKDLITKALLYLGCATFILTGSQTINRFIGNNVSASSGREQLMSLMGYGKMATAGAVTTAVAGAGATMLGIGAGMKFGKTGTGIGLSALGGALGQYGMNDPALGKKQTRGQKIAMELGSRTYNAGEKISKGKSKNKHGVKMSDILMDAGKQSLTSAVHKVAPRASYNPNYYRRRQNIK